MMWRKLRRRFKFGKPLKFEGIGEKIKTEIQEFRLADIGHHINRSAISKLASGQFLKIKKLFIKISEILF